MTASSGRKGNTWDGDLGPVTHLKPGAGLLDQERHGPARSTGPDPAAPVPASNATGRDKTGSAPIDFRVDPNRSSSATEPTLPICQDGSNGRCSCHSVE